MLISRLTSFKEKIKTDDLVRQGLMMVAFGLSVGFLNYLYQLAMSIMLTPAQYGTFFSLASIFVIVMTFSQTFQISVAKFTSKFKAEERRGRINYLWQHLLKRSLLVGVGLFLALVLATPWLSRFLNIDNNWYPPILFSSFVLAFALPTNWGVLQGLQRFPHLGVSSVLWSLLKLAVGVLLVYFGFGLYGGLVSYVVAYIIVFMMTLSFLKDLARMGNEKIELGAFTSYASLALLAIFSFAVLTNIDIVLVKHYLSPENTGNYSAISVLGKVALYAPAGIAVAMFPKTSGLFETGGETRPILRKALIPVLLIAGGVVIVYWLFAGFIVNFLYGDKYPFVAPYLIKYALSMALFAVSFLLMNYLFSLNQTKIVYFFLGAMLLELGLIAFFHSSIAQVVNMMLISGAFCLVLTLLFFGKWMVKEPVWSQLKKENIH